MRKRFLLPIRFKEWWLYKTPFILCMVYAGIILSRQVPDWKKIILFFISFISISVYGYLVNDWCDRKTDLLAGKQNKLKDVKWPFFVAMVTVCLSAGFLPWFFIPHQAITLYLLWAEVFLLTVYCLPPIRLKNRLVWALATDSGYSFVLPFFIAGSVFFPETSLLAKLFMGCWLLLAGTRNILVHQMEDYENDLIANVPTLVTIKGKRFVKRLTERWMLAGEIFFFMLCSIQLKGLFLYLPLVYVIYLLFVYKREVNVMYARGKKLPDHYKFVSDVMLNEFYQSWMPLLFLITASFFNPWALLIGIFHVYFFFNHLKHIWWSLLQVPQWVQGFKKGRSLKGKLDEEAWMKTISSQRLMKAKEEVHNG